MGDADEIVSDDIAAFRNAALNRLELCRPLTLESMEQEQAQLEQRLAHFSDCTDAVEIWAALGVGDTAAVPLMDIAAFLDMTDNIRKDKHA
jgi:malonate decarboxylase beta subunit